MPVNTIKGNLFTSRAQTLVNSVNCVGVMGAGVAYEFRLRYPEMFERYGQLCRHQKIAIGSLWLFKAARRWILNFPTKTDWKLPSRPQYLESGLRKFVEIYAERGITSIAFPVLGAGKGGIAERDSLDIMIRYLEPCPIEIEVYRYDSEARDDLYDDFRSRFANLSDTDVTVATGIRARGLAALRRALEQPHYHTLSQLLRAPGVGEVTLERCFRFVCTPGSTAGQLGLKI